MLEFVAWVHAASFLLCNPRFLLRLLQVFPKQMRWADVAARILNPPVAQYNSEWQLLDVLMHWPWDRVILSRAGMGVVQASHPSAELPCKRTG